MGAFGGLSHQVLELCEDLLDRIEIGAVRLQEQQPGSRAADRLADGGPFVTAQIIHDDNVAGCKRRDKELLDILSEALTVNRLVEHARGVDTITAERREEGHRAPMAIGDFGMEPLTHRRPAAQRRHIGLHPGFVDEDEPGRVKPALILFPLLAPPGNRGPELFGG